MLWRPSRRAVTRVSSAAIALTSPSTRSARALTSSGCRSECQPRTACSTRVEPETYLTRDLLRRADEARCRRQDVKESPAVVAAEDAVVEDDDGATIRGAPDEAAAAPLQSQRRLRQRS